MTRKQVPARQLVSTRDPPKAEASARLAPPQNRAHVTVGQPVTLRIDNTDTVPHSITSPEAGVSIVAEPGTHGYTLLVNQAGRFEWHCICPCDPWSMEHVGYMRGFIAATAS